MKRFLIFVVLLLASITLHAGELVFHWNKMAESKIYDMELMPDNDYFVVVMANEFQVRRTEDGEIFKTYPGTGALSYHDIEFTSDSSQLILAYLLFVEFRELNDLSVINRLQIPSDSEGYGQAIMEIKVDPIRNYIYALVHKEKYENGEILVKRNILIINSKNFEDIKELTTTEDRNLYLQNLAISKDGNYLAVCNEGSSKLIVWSLETQKKVNEYQICPTKYGTDTWGYPSCLKFSELDSDKIYLSGEFPQNNEETDQHSGLFIYSISENKIIDSTFGVGSERIYGGYFEFFENEERLISTNKFVLYVINLKNFLKEVSSSTYYISKQILYSKSKEFILGRGEKHITKLTYKNGSGVKPEPEINKIVYPNPTTGTINIEINCNGNENYYELFNSNSLLINSKKIDSNISILLIDLASYSNGVYYLKVYCGNDTKAYKVIKEN